jgi:periplasmic divalent cation tolerance protein
MSNDVTANFVYITASDKAEALKIGRTIVEERLAACANVIDNMTSVYWWEGAIENSAEVVLIAKTKHELVESLISRVKELHCYSCPCIVSWPINSGNPDYLRWLQEKTK